MELVIKLKEDLEKIVWDIEYIKKEKEEIIEVSDKIDELEGEYVIIKGREKKMLQVAIAILEFYHRNMAGI